MQNQHCVKIQVFINFNKLCVRSNLFSRIYLISTYSRKICNQLYNQWTKKKSTMGSAWIYKFVNKCLLQERRQRKNQNIILTLHFLFPLVVLCRLHDARMLYNLKNFHLYENALSCYKKIKFFCLQAVIKYYITRY